VATPGRVNYLNNRDILKEIHLSKKTYCSFTKPEYHQFDIILPKIEKINRLTITEAKRNRIDRVKRETGEILDIKKIKPTELVFRVMTYEHIPMAAKKVPKAERVKKQNLEDLFGFEDDAPSIEDELDIPLPVEEDLDHIKLNFPPFQHFMLDEDGKPYLVGKSHWRGDLVTGEFSKDHGQMTRKLAHMFIKLCERYATRSNWRGYTYNEEMRGTALLQLSQIGLKFDESKSQNPFAYYTAAITNSFTRVLNEEKKNQNVRDDILELNGLNPSWSRQFANRVDKPSDER